MTNKIVRKVGEFDYESASFSDIIRHLAELDDMMNAEEHD